MGQSLASAAPSRAPLALLAFTLANAALPLLLPMAPGQDTPQHLAYGRILADAESPVFRDAYVPVPGFHPYFLVHKALAALTAPFGVLGAGRVVFVLYAMATMGAFAFLAAVLARRSDARLVVPTAALLGCLAVWNPVVWMGFLPFLLAMPFVLAAHGALLQGVTLRGGPWLAFGAALAFVAALLHVVAGAGLLALTACRLVVAPRGERAYGAGALAIVIAAAAIPFLLVGTQAEAVAATPPLAALVEGVRAHGFGAITTFFGVDWGRPDEKAAYLGIALLGTLPAMPKLLVGGAIVAGLAVVVAKAWTSPRELSSAVARADRRAAVSFLVVALVAPAAVKVPSDIAFLDYRLVALAVLVLLAHAGRIEARLADRARGPRRAFLAVALVATAVWCWVFFGLRREQAAFARLVAPLGADDRLLALPVDDASAYLDERNSVTHYWSLLHTLANGGVTSQFWGRFSPHLPVGHRSGATFPSPSDWRPLDLEEAHLLGATHVLATFPENEPDADRRAAVLRARRRVEDQSASARCEGSLCLFTLRPRIDAKITLP